MQNRQFPRRGEIWWVKDFETRKGSIQKPDRPAVIVSNDKCNCFSPVINIVYITTSLKKDLPTHCFIEKTNIKGTALCEQITSIYKTDLNHRLAKCTDDELAEIEECLKIQLEMEENGSYKDEPVEPDENYQEEPVEEDRCEEAVPTTPKLAGEPQDPWTLLDEARREADMYKRFYYELLDRLMGRA